VGVWVCVNVPCMTHMRSTAVQGSCVCVLGLPGVTSISTCVRTGQALSIISTGSPHMHPPPCNHAPPTRTHAHTCTHTRTQVAETAKDELPQVLRAIRQPCARNEAFLHAYPLRTFPHELVPKHAGVRARVWRVPLSPERLAAGVQGAGAVGPAALLVARAALPRAHPRPGPAPPPLPPNTHTHRSARRAAAGRGLRPRSSTATAGSTSRATSASEPAAGLESPLAASTQRACLAAATVAQLPACWRCPACACAMELNARPHATHANTTGWSRRSWRRSWRPCRRA
jgi:hypothetical protein